MLDSGQHCCVSGMTQLMQSTRSKQRLQREFILGTDSLPYEDFGFRRGLNFAKSAMYRTLHEHCFSLDKKAVSTVSSRRNRLKKRSLHKVNEHFDIYFNEEITSSILFIRCFDGIGRQPHTTHSKSGPENNFVLPA